MSVEARADGARAGAPPRVAAVIPAYRVADRVVGVLRRMPAVLDAVYVVDDTCPEGSGDRVRAAVLDPRVPVLALPFCLALGIRLPG